MRGEEVEGSLPCHDIASIIFGSAVEISRTPFEIPPSAKQKRIHPEIKERMVDIIIFVSKDLLADKSNFITDNNCED